MPNMKGDRLTMNVVSITPNYRQAGDRKLNLIVCSSPDGGADMFEEVAPTSGGSEFQVGKQNSFEVVTVGSGGKADWIKFTGTGGTPVVNNQASIITQVAFKGAIEYLTSSMSISESGTIEVCTAERVLQITEYFAQGILNISKQLKSSD